MSEPLFLNSVMQEKICGTKLRDEFGYDIPSENRRILGNLPSKWRSKAAFQWVGRYEGTDPLLCMQNTTVSCLATVLEPVFPPAF